MITIKSLYAGYSGKAVLKNINLNLKAKNIYALIGPSGCGKSTLLKILCGIIKPDSGDIRYKNQDWNKSKLSIAYAPQNYGLLRWKTVEENITLPLALKAYQNKAKNEKEIYRHKEKLIEILGLRSILKSYPHEISGGQKQRVSLARCFLIKADLLLMDEAFSALDAFTAKASQDLFLKLHNKWQTTTLFITHNIDEAMKIGEKILIMNKKNKSIIQCLDNPFFGSSQITEENIDENKLRELFIFKREIKKILGEPSEI